MHGDGASMLSGDIEKTSFSIQTLQPDHCGEYRWLRLHALQTEGQWFGGCYEEEWQAPLEIWRERCRPDERQVIFGLFEGVHLIGSFTARRWEDDGEGKTAYWGASYLLPAYRGKKLAAPLYAAGEAWSRSHSAFARAIFFIRDDNVRSISIHLKRRARFLHAKPMRWANGDQARACWYEVNLRV